MAEIVPGLFGVSPELFKQQQDMQFRAQALAEAKLDPEQGMIYDAAIRGRNIGRTIGGLLGAEDPVLARQTKENNVLQQVQSSLSTEDMRDPYKLSAAVYEAAMQANLPELASNAFQNMQAGKLANAKVGTEQAQANKINQELATNAELKTALNALPADATDEQKLNVFYKFASPEVSVKALETKNTLAAAREDKMTMAADSRALAREKMIADNETKLEVARQQGANAQLIKSMGAGLALQLAAYDRTTKLELETIRTKNEALNRGYSKDVAEAKASITGIDILTKDTNNFIKQIDNDEVRFGLGTNIAGKTSTMLGLSTDNAIKQADIKRHLRTGVNTLLTQAKGTQTKDDAQRAQDLFLEASSNNDKKSWKAALEFYNKANAKFLAEQKSYITSRGVPLDKDTSGWSIVEDK